MHVTTAGNDSVRRKAVVGVAHCHADHDYLIVRNSGVLAHNRRLHDALTVDHATQPALPGRIHLRVDDGAAVERRHIAAFEVLVEGHYHR